MPPKEPVVSPKSGSIFEKQLIHQYINEHQRDPITSDPLSIEELIEIKSSPYQPPRQPTLNSIPSLLSSLQNEWDSVALELFQLRKQLADTRKELSTALYHHDAAVRVAAKSIKQRDEARAALQELTLSIGNGKPIEQQQVADNHSEDNDVQVTDSAPSEEISHLITTANEELFAQHKAQKQKPNVNLSVALGSIKQVGKHATKPYKKIVYSSGEVTGKIYLTSSTGLTSFYDIVDESYHKDQKIVKNKNITFITNALQNGVSVSLVGTLAGDLLVDDEHKLETDVHKSAVVSIITHPSLRHLAFSVDKSGVYALHDINTLHTLYQGKVNSEVVGASIHTDGALVAIGGAEGTISIIDLRNNEIVTKLETPGTAITDVKFGPNGYWLFGGYTSSDSSNFIKVWDLRKDSSEVIGLSNKTIKILTDKSAQILLSVGDSTVEITQYNKKAKQWISKTNDEPLNTETGTVDGVLIDDNKSDEIELALVNESSEVHKYIISGGSN